MIPFCNIYSTFMQRAYDQVIHDVALQNLPVVFCLDRGGLVGEDGATHHGAYDLAYLRTIPNITISSPLNERELRNLMYTAQLEGKGTFSIRYPRGRGMLPEWKLPFEEIEIGKGQQIKEGKKAAILSIGPVGNFAVKAAQILDNENLSTAVFDIRFLKPMDEQLLHDVFTSFDFVLTVEDGSIIGGFGSAVLEFKNDNNYSSKVKRLGIPDEFIQQGSPDELYKECGFDVAGIVSAVREVVINS